MSRCQQGRTLQSSSSKGKGKEISSTSPHPLTHRRHHHHHRALWQCPGGRGATSPQGCASWDPAPRLPGRAKKLYGGGGDGEGRRAVCDPRDHCLSIRSGLEARGPLIFGGWGVSVMSDMKFACSIMQKWGLQSELFCLRNKEVATPCTSGPNHTRVTPVKRAASVPEAGSREHRGARVLFRTCRL